MKNFILVNLNDKNQVKVTSINNENLLKIQNTSNKSNETIKLKQILPQKLSDDDNWQDENISNSSFTSTKHDESLLDEDESKNDDDFSVDDEKPKKRCRLTHLTSEEKLQRRKLKNRIAAQNARDRKKVRMDNLEVTVKTLQEENKKLQIENKKLKEQTKELTEENMKLKMSTNLKRKLNDVDQNCESKETAVFLNIVSQQQRLTHNSNQQNLMVLMVCWLMSLLNSKAINSNDNSNKAAIIRRKKQIVKLKLLRLVRLLQLKIHQKQRLKTCLNSIVAKRTKNNKQLQLFQQIKTQNSNLNLKKLFLLIMLSMKRV